MKEAIELAIKGGYKLGNDNTHKFEGSDSHYSSCWYSDGHFDYLIPEMMLDPLFWKALGKAEGWGKPTLCNDGSIRTFDHGKNPEWRKVWHRFIDHLSGGGSIDSFFTNLIKGNE